LSPKMGEVGKLRPISIPDLGDKSHWSTGEAFAVKTAQGLVSYIAETLTAAPTTELGSKFNVARTLEFWV